MKKTLVILLTIVLGLFICVSCDINKSVTRCIPDGHYAGPKATAPYAYLRFSGTRVFAYKAEDITGKEILLRKGDYVIQESKWLKFIWDDGNTSTYTITWPYESNELFQLSDQKWQYDRIGD